MAGFLAGLQQGIGGAASGGGAAGLAGATGADASTMAIPSAAGAGYGAAGAGAGIGSFLGQGAGGFGRGYLGLQPAQGTMPGFNVPSAGYGLGQLAQRGGGQPMNPQQIMGIIQSLLPQQQQGPATRLFPAGPQPQGRGLIGQLFAGI